MPARRPTTRSGVVSVVTINYKGADDTIACLLALGSLDWPADQVELVCVDNASGDGSAERIRAAVPRVRLVESPTNTGFAGGCNLGVAHATGEYDERFFMFYEDVDFGWRLNLLGHRVRYVPASVAYHRHHVTMTKFGSWRERYLLERNALLCLYKNLEDATLARVLAPAISLAIRRTIAMGGDDPTVLDLQRSPGGEGSDRLEVSKTSLAGPYAV